VRHQWPRRLLVALLVAELVCVAMWVFVGGIWWALGAIIVGASLVLTVLFSNG
jgi:hypothetical protein